MNNRSRITNIYFDCKDRVISTDQWLGSKVIKFKEFEYFPNALLVNG